LAAFLARRRPRVGVWQRDLRLEAPETSVQRLMNGSVLKITSLRCCHLLVIGASLLGLLLSGALNAAQKPAAAGGSQTRTRTNYHGWADSWILCNGKVEAVIVPTIGRVMQFRFVGEEDGPFWENRAMDGKQPDPKATEWGNFGGDKTWPAPQEDWPKVTKRSWPPPPAFDSMPVKAETVGVGVTLISAVDPFYGIRTKRLVLLDANKPEMMIATTYEKVTGPPRKVAIWTITQLRDPAGVFLSPYPLAPWPSGYNQQSDRLPANLRLQDHLLSLTRDPSGKAISE
jgi:hypothetical protein